MQPHARATVAAAGFEGEEDMAGMPVEALLGMDMAHPNVVQTYRHTSLPTAVSQLTTAVLHVAIPLCEPCLMCQPASKRFKYSHICCQDVSAHCDWTSSTQVVLQMPSSGT